MDTFKTIAVNVAAAVILGALLVWGNALYRQHVQFDKGERALAARNFNGAVAGYESAIHMYTPGSSLVGLSAQRLWELGQQAEKSGDAPRALIAYRALRSSFYAVAGLYAPGQQWIERCDQRIAVLVKGQTGQTEATTK
jgi:hypothetical protein